MFLIKDLHSLIFTLSAGRSSLVIHMEVVSSWTTIPWLEANFVFVARDPETKLAKAVPPLECVTEEEKVTFARIEATQQQQKRTRQERQKDCLNVFGLDMPSEECSAAAASLLQVSTPLLALPTLTDPSAAFISSTKMSNTVICHHQYRNIHGRIFGGFLMRQAYELAFLNAYTFLGSQPVFREVDQIVFRRPVEIGDIFRFDSCVILTVEKDEKRPHPLIHLEVVASIVKPEHQSVTISNVFHFTFESRVLGVVKRVLPTTIEEAIRMANVMEMNKNQE